MTAQIRVPVDGFSEPAPEVGQEPTSGKGRPAGSEKPGGQRSVRRVPIVVGAVVLGIGLFVALVVSVGVGPIELSPSTVLDVLSHNFFGAGSEPERLDNTVVMDLRLPRVIFGALAGAALAVSGACLQSLFRNPLADPGIIGVSGGASTGAVAAIVLLPPLSATATAWLVPAAAFAAGLAATSLIYILARPQRSGGGTARLLLVGIAIGSGFAALTGFLTYVADDDELESVVFWQMGSLGSISMIKLALVAPPLIVGLIYVCTLHRKIDLLTLGERSAQYLGLNVMSLRRQMIVITALLTGATVAFAGTIGFVGLVIPHVTRMIFGPTHKAVLPLSALLGGLLIVVADSLARVVAPPQEVPIGLFTAALGSPFFLMLVLRTREAKS